MYKIIACDLDETLISRDRSISKENIEAIQRAKQAGVRFVPATGRGYNSVRNELKTLGLYDLENEYVISYNGGAITENKDERVLHFQGITFKEAQDLYIRGLSYDHICIHIYTPDQVWVRNFYPEEVEYLCEIASYGDYGHAEALNLNGEWLCTSAQKNCDFCDFKIPHFTKKTEV